jgi:hypothetical protein
MIIKTCLKVIWLCLVLWLFFHSVIITLPNKFLCEQNCSWNLLVCLKSVKKEKSGSFQVRSQWILWSHALKRLIVSLKISFWKKNLSNKFKIFLSLLDKFSSKMIFLNSKKVFQENRIRVFLEKWLEASRHFLFFRFETNQMC